MSGGLAGEDTGQPFWGRARGDEDCESIEGCSGLCFAERVEVGPYCHRGCSAVSMEIERMVVSG
jgi:hypothetical protein